MGTVSQNPERKIYLSISGLFQKKKNKQAGWGNAFVNTPMKFRRSLPVWKVMSIKICNTAWKYQGQKRDPLTMLLFCWSSTHCLIHSREFHILTFTRSYFHVFKPIASFATGIVRFRRNFGLWQVVNDNPMCQQSS